MTKPLHITVGAAVQSNASLTNDIRLVKAAILYGDSATLCSLGSTMLVNVLAFTELETEDRLRALIEIAPILNHSMDTQALKHMAVIYHGLRRKRPRSKQEILLCGRLEAQLERVWTEMHDRTLEMSDKAGLAEIVCATESGLLTLHPLQRLDDTDALIQEFFDAVADSIVSADTYPLLDDQVGDLVAAAIREGRIGADGADATKAKAVALAAGLIEQLPLFDYASMSEIIDIRRELQDPLVRFRSGIIELAESIGHAAWDKDFTKDVELVLRRDVEPAVLEIREALETNKYLKQLAVSLAKKPLVVPGASGLGLLLSSLDVASREMSAALGIVAGGVVVAHDAYEEWKARQREIASNRLFFYYRAGELIRK